MSAAMGTKEPSLSSLDDIESKGSSIPLEFDDYPLDLIATITKSSAPSTCTNSPILKHHLKSNGFSMLGTNRLFGSDISKSDILLKNVNSGNSVQVNHYIKPKLGPQLSLDEYSNMAEENHDLSERGCCRDCCQSLRKSCDDCCFPCLTKHHPLSSRPTLKEICCYAFMLPPHGRIGHVLTLAVSTLLVYGVFWAITGPQSLPGGNLFALVLLVVLGVIVGAVVELVKLPALLGMLLVGCLLRNLPVINFARDIENEWSSSLRNAALTLILLKAGLGLDPVALKKLSFTVLRLAFTPCIGETAAVAVASHLLLGLPWTWGIMLGFILSAVTPAVVVPSMLSLQNRGFGVDQGIPTLVIAAASVDDVLAITGFTVVLAISFSQGSIALTIARGPLEALGGVIYGVILGLLCWYLPHSKHKNVAVHRFVMLLSAGMFAAFGSRALNCPGAGALGCLVVAFVAAIRWRKEGWTENNNPVEYAFEILWVIFEPLLFGLIGTEIDLSKIDGSTIGLGVAVIFIGLALRMLVSFLAVFGAGFTLKEKFFIPFAWLPKATVQAAIGSVALDTARAKGAPDDQIRLGQIVVTIAVLAILISAPLGAAVIALTGPKLLKRSSQQSPDGDTEQESETAQLNITTSNNVDQEYELKHRTIGTCTEYSKV